MAHLVFTILGCGSSAGVPRIGEGGGDWGECDPTDPKNRRRRCALLVGEASRISAMPHHMPASMAMPARWKPMPWPIQYIGRCSTTPIVTSRHPSQKAQA